MFQLHGLHELVMCLYKQQRNTLHVLARVDSGMNVRTDNIRLANLPPSLLPMQLQASSPLTFDCHYPVYLCNYFPRCLCSRIPDEDYVPEVL